MVFDFDSVLSWVAAAFVLAVTAVTACIASVIYTAKLCNIARKKNPENNTKYIENDAVRKVYELYQTGVYCRSNTL